MVFFKIRKSLFNNEEVFFGLKLAGLFFVIATQGTNVKTVYVLKQ